MMIKRFGPQLLIIAMVSLAYGNNLNNEFLWDDEFLIQKNMWLKSYKNLPKMLVSNSTAGFGGKDNFYRPTQNIYYLIIYQMFGFSKPAFHIGNILLHIINALLIFFLILRLTKNRQLALVTSLLWACHPTHTEAITYISGTADPMATLFCLSSLLAFPIKSVNLKGIGFSLFFYALALLSKEAIIVTPPLLMIFIFFSKSKLSSKDYLWTLPHWLLSFIYLILRQGPLNFANTFQFYKESNIYTENILYRVYTYLATLPEYLKIVFWPTDLHMERDFPVHTTFFSQSVLLGASILVLTGGLTIYCYFKRRNQHYLFGFFWFFAAFVPMMGILIPVNSFILEHWLYLPSIGLILGISMLVNQTKKIHSKLPLLFTIVLAVTLAGLTAKRNQDWSTAIRFYSNILKYSEGSARVHNNLAMAYSEKQHLDKAIKHYQKAIAIADIYPQTRYNLARLLVIKQQYQQALKQLDRSLAIDPTFKYAEVLKAQVLEFLAKQK